MTQVIKKEDPEPDHETETGTIVMFVINPIN